MGMIHSELGGDIDSKPLFWKPESGIIPVAVKR
jgi:hypothetical protein